MIVKLKNLSESLEAKQLNESYNTQLTEAFNDSFPKWLKDRLVTIRKYHGTDKENDYEGSRDRDYHSVPYKDRPSYSMPRGQYVSNTRNLGLFSNLLNATDLQDVEIIEGPIPEKRTDPRLKEPNIPIWGFANGQVYIPGFNDQEESRTDTFNDGRVVAFKYAPFKVIQPSAVHFAYIDGSKMPKSTYKELRKERAQTAQELRDMDYGRRGGRSNDPKRFSSPFGDKDKSGYPINPNKYAKKLADLRASRYSEVLQETYEMLLDYRDDITATMQYYDPVKDKEEFRAIKNAFVYLNRAIDDYNQAVENIDDVVNASYYDEEDKRGLIGRYLKNLKSADSFKNLKTVGDSIFLSGANWLQ